MRKLCGGTFSSSEISAIVYTIKSVYWNRTKWFLSIVYFTEKQVLKMETRINRKKKRKCVTNSAEWQIFYAIVFMAHKWIFMYSSRRTFNIFHCTHRERESHEAKAYFAHKHQIEIEVERSPVLCWMKSSCLIVWTCLLNTFHTNN